ncbi:MAG: hypothetical protein WBA57_01780 [Elainellaceae cyanobacterium]
MVELNDTTLPVSDRQMTELGAIAQLLSRCVTAAPNITLRF